MQNLPSGIPGFSWDVSGMPNDNETKYSNWHMYELSPTHVKVPICDAALHSVMAPLH